MFIGGCVRFAAEGVGVPLPVEPSSRQLTVGGPYRYERNPLYLAWATAITGQAPNQRPVNLRAPRIRAR